MVYITKSGDGASVAAPLGMSPSVAGAHFGELPWLFGLGCGAAYEEGGPAPIQLSDGFTPCVPDRQVQFDFQPRRGMVGVTCSVTSDKQAAFVQRMNSAFGDGQKVVNGTTRWTLGQYVVASSEYVIFCKTLRKVSVYEDAR